MMMMMRRNLIFDVKMPLFWFIKSLSIYRTLYDLKSTLQSSSCIIINARVDAFAYSSSFLHPHSLHLHTFLLSLSHSLSHFKSEYLSFPLRCRNCWKRDNNSLKRETRNSFNCWRLFRNPFLLIIMTWWRPFSHSIQCQQAFWEETCCLSFTFFLYTSSRAYL